MEKVRIRLSLEVILVIIVLVFLYKGFGPGGDKAIDELKTTPPTELSGTTGTPQATKIFGKLLDSGLVDEYKSTDFPVIPDRVPIFDKSKFTELTIKQYNAGTYMTMTFIHNGTSDFDQFGKFYSDAAKAGGWQTNMDLYLVNGTKTVFEDETVEVRAVTIIKKDESGEPYVKEKLKIYELK